MTELQEERRQRKLDRAFALARKGQADCDRGHEMFSVIPMGQPILVGHHSEGRDRRYRNRAHNALVRGWDLQKQAARIESSANGRQPITSDDPEAVEALTAQLERAEAVQAKMKAANPLVKKGNRAGLLALGFTESQVDGLFTPDFCGRIGFPAFELTNNGANIRRLKARIALLQEVAVAPERGPVFEYEDAAVSVFESDDRLQFRFSGGKPPQAVRDALRSHGFLWSPNRGTHVRKVTPGREHGLRYAAESIVKVIQAQVADK